MWFAMVMKCHKKDSHFHTLTRTYCGKQMTFINLSQWMNSGWKIFKENWFSHTDSRLYWPGSLVQTAQNNNSISGFKIINKEVKRYRSCYIFSNGINAKSTSEQNRYLHFFLYYSLAHCSSQNSYLF